MVFDFFKLGVFMSFDSLYYHQKMDEIGPWVLNPPYLCVPFSGIATYDITKVVNLSNYYLLLRVCTSSSFSTSMMPLSVEV